MIVEIGLICALLLDHSLETPSQNNETFFCNFWLLGEIMVNRFLSQNNTSSTEQYLFLTFRFLESRLLRQNIFSQRRYVRWRDRFAALYSVTLQAGTIWLQFNHVLVEVLNERGIIAEQPCW